MELAAGRELLLGDAQTLGDRLRRVGSAALETCAQRLRVRWRDEHLDRFRHRHPHLPRALNLDLEHHRPAGREAPLDLRPKGPVAVAAVRGMLEEVAPAD